MSLNKRISFLLSAGHPLSTDGGKENPNKELTSAALIAMALQAASREASDEEDNNEGTVWSKYDVMEYLNNL